MKSTLTGLNAHDFHQRHNHTYGFFQKPSGERLLVYVKSVTGNECKFETRDGQAFTAFADAGVEFEFLPVLRGWWDRPDGRAVHFNRIPARQFQRGIARGNTELYTYDDRGRCRDVPIGFDVLSDVFCPAFGAVAGISRWKEGRGVLAALGRHFAIDDIALYFHIEKIGTVLDNKRKVSLSSDLYMQEVMDAMRRNQVEIEVSVNG